MIGYFDLAISGDDGMTIVTPKSHDLLDESGYHLKDGDRDKIGAQPHDHDTGHSGHDVSTTREMIRYIWNRTKSGSCPEDLEDSLSPGT